MSVSSEWNSLKATWVLLLIALSARIFLSGQFLLTPEEAVYWYSGTSVSLNDPGPSPVMSWLIQLSTALFGNNETAVRLPALLSVTLASFFMALSAASMFSWHTAFHVTLLSQGILQLNMAALIISPYTLLLPCWAAVCYHCSQALHNNRVNEWLFAGFWFGIGLLCSFSIILLLPCIAMCFVLIRPFRTCVFYPGPWLGLLLSLCLFWATGYFGYGDFDLAPYFHLSNLKDLSFYLVPDLSYSLNFLVDQIVLLSPVVFLLIMIGWLTGTSQRHLVKPDVQFLILTSFPLFLIYFLFPFFSMNGAAWPLYIFISALVLIAGLHSSTRSSLKGRPKRRWILCIITAYLVTVPLLLELTYPSFSFQLNIPQTRLMTSGWDHLGQETKLSLDRMPSKANTFIFSMDSRVISEMAFYTSEDIQSVSLDRSTRMRQRDYLENELQLVGRDGLGLVSTRASLDQLKHLFERVEVERELKLKADYQGGPGQTQSYFVVRGFNFKKIRS